MLRRTALFSAEAGGNTDNLVFGNTDNVVVAEAHLTEALDELLDDRPRLTRVLLGG